MNKNEVIYLGRCIAKEGFRAFVYGHNGLKRLVNSWLEYEAHKLTGEWFDEEPVAQVKEEPVVQEVVKDDAPVLDKSKKKGQE